MQQYTLGTLEQEPIETQDKVKTPLIAYFPPKIACSCLFLKYTDRQLRALFPDGKSLFPPPRQMSHLGSQNRSWPLQADR
jgi:hypothetical protein